VNFKITAMAFKTKFFIRTTKKHGETRLRIRATNGRKFDLWALSGFQIDINFWNNDKGIIRQRVEFTNSRQFEKQLTDLADHVKNEYFNLADDSKINNDWLNEVVDRFHNPEKYNQSKKQMSFFEYLEYFIKQSDKRLNDNGNVISNKRKIDYKITRNYLIDFAEYTGKRFDFADIDLEFYTDIVAYLRDIKGLAPNTIGKFIKVLKTVLNQAVEDGQNHYLKYKSKRFKAISEETENIYLNKQELQQLYDFDFSDKPYLERVRDLFIVACYTGLRFSDLHKIKSENIVDDILYLKQTKTGDKIELPIHNVVYEILNKYNGVLPEKISNQKFNDYIKTASRLAGIDAKFTKQVTENGLSFDKKFAKYELISSHTARRTFCTNCYNDGIPTNIIRKISGHKTESAFLTYIKADVGESAKKMLEIWNKNEPLRRVK
jgi:integrase